jgi:hypothetical protein
MDWTVVIVVAAVVGVLGTVAAVLWWRLVNKKIPYQDAHGAGRREDVVIIRDEGPSGRTP